MGKQSVMPIEVFVGCLWQGLAGFKQLHRQTRTRLIEVWDNLDRKRRNHCRAEFWQYIHQLEWAFEDHRDEVVQYRDECFARRLAGQENFLPPGEEFRFYIGESPLGQIHDNCRRAAEDAWKQFHRTLADANLWDESSKIMAVVHDCDSQLQKLLAAQMEALRKASIVP